MDGEIDNYSKSKPKIHHCANPNQYNFQRAAKPLFLVFWLRQSTVVASAGSW